MLVRDRIAMHLSHLADPVVLELGAYNGCDTGWLREICKGSPTYVAVEPDARHLPGLWQIPGIQIIPVAIASYTGTITFYLSDHGQGEVTYASSIRKPKFVTRAYPPITFGRSVVVPCETLDHLTARLDISHVDLIWADMQGAEKDLVLGGLGTLAHTDWFFVESYEMEMYEGQALRSEFVAMLPEFEVVQAEYEDILLCRKGQPNA